MAHVCGPWDINNDISKQVTTSNILPLKSFHTILPMSSSRTTSTSIIVDCDLESSPVRPSETSHSTFLPETPLARLGKRWQENNPELGSTTDSNGEENGEGRSSQLFTPAGTSSSHVPFSTNLPTVGLTNTFLKGRDKVFLQKEALLFKLNVEQTRLLKQFAKVTGLNDVIIQDKVAHISQDDPDCNVSHYAYLFLFFSTLLSYFSTYDTSLLPYALCLYAL